MAIGLEIQCKRCGLMLLVPRPCLEEIFVCPACRRKVYIKVRKATPSPPADATLTPSKNEK